MDSTAFVIVSCSNYLYRAKRTIIDLHSKGQLLGDIVIIALGNLNLNQNFIDFYNISITQFPEIKEKNELLKVLNYSNFPDTIDGIETKSTKQWESYFKKWNRIISLDAGLRVLDNVHNGILKLDYKNSFLAPDDSGRLRNDLSRNPDKIFKTQISLSKPELLDKLKEDIPNVDLNGTFF